MTETVTQCPPGSLWTIVLAGGEGTRLQPLTRALHGEEVPKQFAAIREGRSLLQATLDRTIRFCPHENTLIVVAAARENLARVCLLPEHARVELVLQPKNLGTAPGILLPLSHVAVRAPEATVVISPSDHFIANEAPFSEAIQRAIEVAARRRAIVLVGAVAERAETEYGWIVPGSAPESGVRSVLRFVEKPSPELAPRLLRDGALWNTFLFAAPVATLLTEMRACLPEHSASFDGYRRALGASEARAALSEAYGRLPPADFSRDVLAKVPGLLVVPLPPCGWSDWGTPQRVFQSLRGSYELERLRERLGKNGMAADVLDSWESDVSGQPAAGLSRSNAG